MNIGICGIGGRMGKAILEVLLERNHTLGAAFDSDSSPVFGQNVNILVNRNDIDVTVTSINQDDIQKVDGIIDFSSPKGSLALIEAAKKCGIPVVIGTTGFTDKEQAVIAEASKEIPILMSPNMSLAVNLLFKLTEMASKALPAGFDVEIFEAHHRFKKDAPSGTARKLLEVVKESKEGLKDAEELSGRSGIPGERTDSEIAVMAMRGGDIVGEHTVFFTGMGERIELTHRAMSRDIFARGAVTAMEFLQDKAPGIYSTYDVLGL